MNLLYIAPTKIEMNQLDGVAKKILAHVRVFAKEYSVSLLYRDAQNVMLYKFNSNEFIELGTGKNKFDIIRIALSIIEQENYDYCYIRYPNSDPQFITLLKKMKEARIRVAIEIPTFPYDAEGTESVKGRIIKFVDNIYRRKLYKYVGRIVTYSEDDTIFGVKTIRTVNGLDFDKVRISKTPKYDDTIHLCGVATFHRIHGYDRLIKGMQNYYNEGGQREIIFDVVGYGDDSILQKYKEMVRAAQLDKKVIFHGRLHGTDLDDVYDLASIGVNSLAIHRQNLERESTLKTREYAAKGLPIISSSFVDAFNEIDNARFVCLVPPDDSAIDMNHVINFYDNLIKNSDIEDLKRGIRSNSALVCDMPVTLRPVIAYFDSKCDL